MATPIGHSLAGYAVCHLSGPAQDAGRVPLIWLCILLSIAPDLDFLPGILLGRPAMYHQGVTHSLGFALMVSLMIAVLYTLKGWPFPAIFKLAFFAYSSHLVLDFFGYDGRPPYGMPLFWPLSMEYFISPVPLFWGVRHAQPSSGSILEWVDGILNFYNLGAIALEIVLVAPFAILAQMYRFRRSKHAGV
jgi:inner membrane protein